MRYEIINTITKDDKGWKYTGQIIDGDERIPVEGRVSLRNKTDGMIKRAIIVEMQAKVKQRQQITPTIITRKLSVNNIFKDKLSAEARR